ncbi:MAG TPA: amylo-alpha-1,6-glucosidase [Candidatus Acidoferrum sp.]|nr:amylo-alpha-1,6-glucosidase [Candidatus Acidoferrum sp.]
MTTNPTGTSSLPSGIRFGREICGDLSAAESREWLVTNGIGGFASGTIAGSSTRRYHGLLIAALQPPLGRTQLVAALDETVRYADASYQLATHRWASGAIEPQGYLLLDSFRLEGTTPVWTFALADALLEKRIWMAHGKNTTYVQYALVCARNPIEFECKVLVNYRDFHSVTHAANWRMNISPVEHGAEVLAFERATLFYLKSVQAVCELRHEWYRDCLFPLEKERGLDDREDQLFAALFRAKLHPGESLDLICSTDSGAQLDGQSSHAQESSRQATLLTSWQRQSPGWAAASPSWLPQLVLAADQFIVSRALPDETEGHSIIAGYHWFGDWGRDTMISLPGLALATGRPQIARQILLAFSRFVDGGMLPNNFPDAGGKPGYNTVDATLWYFEAVRQYFDETQDLSTLRELYPILDSIITAHLAGTRYNIHVDSNDALLYAGGPGVQLTWMDAKVGDWVVTPRTGKPVEINALWINALESIAGFGRQMNKPVGEYERLAAQAKNSFQKFWNRARNFCFDVIDAPSYSHAGPADPTLRPNQIFAVSLPESPLRNDQQKSVVDVCARHLLTCFGLRSLAPGEPDYQGHYGGEQRSRDAAYHQGTVWGWLLGPFALAHYRVYRDRAAALRFLEPLGTHTQAYGLGTLAEIFDGDPPHAPRGCIAQAWTVGELLRALTELSRGA